MNANELELELKNYLHEYFGKIINDLQSNAIIKFGNSIDSIDGILKYMILIKEVDKIREDCLTQIDTFFRTGKNIDYNIDFLKLICLKQWCLYIPNKKLRQDFKNDIGLLITTDRYLNVMQNLLIR